MRIHTTDHPMNGMIGTVTATIEDGLSKVTLLESSFSGYFRPEDLQAIEVGTKVLVEVSITRFFEDSMMIAGGWMSLNRILDVIEE